ncbi:hypothetical protein A8L34_01260 [Bacillus sp. FJAT-27264]|uniref:hypothetical protein n=1 Tax=Paenibacillus sp. (strain DSM 101736 / FJAT-27264) TaxID=1850362 RepID=UPI000807EEEF|nr:hypothetical protein [Bacillus sp. FJAT-27264]OBZ18246.1 hypothetical protein A8L34_01260 [Bacillus sp. FJAT-27264]
MKDTRIPESEQSKELFAYFGLAVYYCQALEQQLTNLLLLTKLSQGKTPTEADLTDLYQRKLSNSLGQLIKEIQHHFPFSEEETAQLQEVWKQRNHIVHDYFKERIQETFTSAGRSQMLRELKRFKNKACKLEKTLQGYCTELYAKLGLEEEHLI